MGHADGTTAPGWSRGRLDQASDAPATGETVKVLLERGGVVIEQILSGRLDGPQAYEQDHDEWVVVLEGAALLDVEGTELRLRAGDWALLPAGTRHTLHSTEPCTNWLAVRVPR
jgi:cupin 2 domain-containing protein